MQSKRTRTSPALVLSSAIAGILAFAPAAFAQEPASTDATASGKHFSVVGGVAMGKPTGGGTIAGERASFDGEAAPTLGMSYNINDNIAIEAWGAADKIGQRVRGAGGKVGSVESQPVALSGQYHFRAADSTVRPFVGLGYFESNIDAESVEPGGALDGQRLGMTTPKGAMATVGLDLNLSPTWFARADARYLHGGSDIEVDGARVGHADLDPVLVGLGVGARF
jgi:outer membrane protein